MQDAAFVKPDVYKTVQVSVMTADCTRLIKSISNMPADIKNSLGMLPKSVKIAMKSSSTWMATIQADPQQART